MSQPIRTTTRVSSRMFLSTGLLAGMLAVGGAQTARAATFTVTNINDSGTGSLRQAILDANASPGADTIDFSVSGTIVLASTLEITVPLTIDGAGQTITISGNNAVRVMDLTGGPGSSELSVNRLTIINGSAPAGSGGAIHAGRSLTVTNCTFAGNSAKFGGAISNGVDALTVTNSTFSNNSAQYGGAIFSDGDTVSILNSTLSGNSAAIRGGAIHNAGPGTADITNSTISGNTAGVGNGIWGTSVTLKNSILANSLANCQVDPPFTADSSNLATDSSCNFATFSASINLGPLQNNGGPTETMALLVGSAAINAGNNAHVPLLLTTDQRGTGFSRTKFGTVDVGAFERSTSTVTNIDDSGTGSLRQAILDANASPGADTIDFSVSGTIVLASTLEITVPLTIDGAGQTITISGNNAVQVMDLTGGPGSSELSVNGLTIINGSAPAGHGGAIHAGRSLTVTNCSFAGNSAKFGGAISNSVNALTVTNSTFSNNSAQYGGAIFGEGDAVFILNSTLSGNSAALSGGAINNLGPGTADITNSTISGNTATVGGGIWGGSVTLKNSILANSGANCNVDPPFTADSSNLATDGSCDGATFSASINLGPLANNGGPTETMALLAGSAAINAGTDAYALAALLTTDQRGTGFPRIGLDRVDVGAFELQQCYAGQWYDGLGCVNADPGYFVPLPGATSQTACSTGYFQPNSGSVSCNAATAGHYVAFIGQPAESACDLGTYQPNIAQSSCLAAPAGRYVDATGAIASTLCAAGTYQPSTGSSSCLLASPGFYVPTAGAASQLACAPGFTSLAGATVCTQIVPVFPANSILDNFNRANGGVGSSWAIATSTLKYKIAGNRLDVQLGGPLVWKPTAFGTSQEAFVKLATIDSRSPSQGLKLKVQSGAVPNSGAILVVYDAPARAVRVSTLRFNVPVWKHYNNVAATFVNGDQLGARALASGNVEIYKNGARITTVVLNAADQAFFNSKGGKIGLWTLAAPNAFFDDFGGGTIVP